MPTTTMPLLAVGALALTRAALGAGVGLLVADRLEPRMRRVLGVSLLAAGVVSTIPVVASIVTGIGTPARQRPDPSRDRASRTRGR